MLIVGPQQIPVVVNGATQYFNNTYSVRLNDDGSGTNFVTMPFELSNRTFMLAANGVLDIARVDRMGNLKFINSAIGILYAHRSSSANRQLSPITFPVVPQNKIAFYVYGTSRNGWAKGRGHANITFYWN
ncbi:hypothetical protein [Helicobacter mesocricetorum]|uniref:hypothetical protein n=1 Tax=Helicobacter mesocricetorum TaxID=87012 RepID=UPI000CF0B866|nr:hypothetical protein [Helicobacter mesocricetorum]